MPTILGITFFCLGAYCFLVREEWLLGLLILSSIFQAGSAINIGDRGVQPYYLIACFLIARALLNTLLGVGPRDKLPERRWLLIFGAIAIASAPVLPVIFAGTPIYDQTVGIDEGLFIRPALRLGLNNFAQAGFLLLHIAAVFASLRVRFSQASTRRACLWAFYLVVLVIVVQGVFQATGHLLPDSLIRNNPGYSISDATQLMSGTRNPGPFAEPSAAGAFLLIFCVGFLAEYLAGRAGLAGVIIALVASGLVSSSGSIFAIAAVSVVLMFRYSPLRGAGLLRRRQLRRVGWLLLWLVIPVTLALVLSPSYRETLFSLTVAKGDTGSFVARSAADLYSLDILVHTYGLGVGIGSNRASSLLATLGSDVGLLGVIAFTLFYLRLFAHVRKEDLWIKWAGYGLLLNMCFGIADVTIPFFWVPIMLAVQSAAGRNLTEQGAKSRSLLRLGRSLKKTGGPGMAWDNSPERSSS